ncbi:hypothetical protein KAH37_01405 [bacterium]|nr:hypothetical protein [bacterium]
MMKFLILLTTVLTMFSCGKPWEGCGGAKYTASVEESETIFKTESFLYDGFHCPVMEDAWTGTDSKEFVENIIGVYKITNIAFVLYPKSGPHLAYYEKISLEDIEFEQLGVWREFTIESLLSCDIGVAQSGEECADHFYLDFKSDKGPFNFALTRPLPNLTYVGSVAKSEVDVMYGPDVIYIDDVRIDIDAPFVLKFNVEGEEYDGVILSYDKE